MMQRRFSKEEQQVARNVNMVLFLMDYYEPYRYELNERGFLLDNENKDWIGDVKNNHWFDNSLGAKHPHGNIIDYLMFFEGCSFPDAMNTLLEYIERNNENKEERDDDFEYPFA